MTKIKICGITNYEDAINATDLGVEYLGFNFYKKSPRYIIKSNAKKIIDKLPKKVKKVGIFVNENISKIKNTVDFCYIDIVQLSGNEDKNFIIKLKKILNKKIIKSFRVRNRNDIEDVKHYKTDYIMLDSFKNGFYGGTGTKFDWNLAKYVDRKRLFLSGGLDTSNVELAINNIKPYAVDVCSSIEAYPGKKNLGKMKKFVEAAR